MPILAGASGFVALAIGLFFFSQHFPIQTNPGIYDAEGFGKLRFYVMEGSLWIESMTAMLTVRQIKTIALDQSKFELENLKGFSYVFVDAQDYDMISVRGQITRY